MGEEEIMKKPIMKMEERIKIGEKVYKDFEKEYGRNPNWPAETTTLGIKASNVARKRQGLPIIKL